LLLCEDVKVVNRLKRLNSSVPGLDAVLCGGFIAGASYIFQGRPGAGKTILANQIAFAQANEGQRVLYVTLLAESHERLFEALSTLDFYDAAAVGNTVTFISVFQTLRAEGLSAVVSLLRREMGRQNCSMLIVDGLLNVRDTADATLDVKTFVAELQANAAFSRCTVLMLTSASPGEASPEHTMVDGVLELHEDVVGAKTIRRLQVTKSRGSAALGGFHSYEITTAGITVYPRLELFLARPTDDTDPPEQRVPSGIADMDELIQGGFPSASFTLLMGPSGSGKTTFGLSYLKLATPEQPAVMFGFYESPRRLAFKARAIGIELDGLVASGALKIIWHPLTENLLDKLAYDLLDAVRSLGARRVFIDGLSGFERAVADPARLVEFFSGLSNELRTLGITTIATWESRNIFGLQSTSPVPEISGIVDNLLLLRQTQSGSELKRVLALLKIRDGNFDGALHLISVTRGGLRIDGRFQGGENIGIESTRSSETAHK
jgi:circadian clock protein KaiC